MDGIFGNLLNALAEIWKNIGLAQKVSIVLTGIATIGACALVVYFGTRPDWQILYADMDPKQAAKVYDLVSGAGVQVKLSDSGKTLLVPSKDVYKMRLKVAGEGIQPNAITSGGWETFDKLPLGATDLQQQLAKQRALQGELEKMINEMPGVASSRVMLTIPQKSVFKKDKLHPTASVMINLQQGNLLAGQEVNGIRCLISSSVSGMTPDDVTISDNRGNLLARQSSEDGDSGGDNSKFMDMQTRMERMLKEKAEAILRPIVGPENVVAMVSCDLDFDNIDKVTEEYNPENVVVLSEKSVTEDMSKNGGGSGGKPGASSNVPSSNEATADVSDPAKRTEDKVSKEQKQVVDKTYAVSKTVQKVAIKAGRIKSIAVAVTVAKKADGKSWTAEEKSSFESLVSAAVGASIYQNNVAVGATNPQTSPNVTVKEMDFFKEPKAEYKASMLESLGETVNSLSASPLIRPILGLLMLGVLFIVFKNYFGKGSDGNDVTGANAVFSEEIRQLPSESSAGNSQAELAPIMDALQAKANASPQTVAALMENWLSQDQG